MYSTLTKAKRWLFEPMALPIWSTVLGWFVVSVASMFLFSSITPITEASFCFMDAVLWVDGLLNYWYGGMVAGQMEGDRPPLSLWMGAWFLSFGYTEVQALQLVARLSLSALIATTVMGLLQRTSVLVMLSAVWMLLGSASFGKLMLWLNAEMLVNALFVLHLFVGWWVLDCQRNLRSKWMHRASIALMGGLAGVTVCAKEQGLLLFPISMLLIALLPCTSWKALKGAFARLGWYGIGAIPPMGWYGSHFLVQWQEGEKWRIFVQDLNIMSQQTTLSDQLHASTTWGTFSSRFGEADSWMEFFNAASTSLLQDMRESAIGTIAFFTMTVLCISVWNRFQPDEQKSWQWDWRMGLWILGHLLPTLPLLLVPIFEPYHYTVLWAPVVILLAWSTQQWFKQWGMKAMVMLCPMLYWAYEGTELSKTLQLERENCIATCLIPVRMWMRQNTSDRATLWVTDSLTPYDRSLYPQAAKSFSSYAECSYQDYVATSGLSNQVDLFASEREQYPKAWTQVNSIVSINKEVWKVYRAVCHERSTD